MAERKTNQTRAEKLAAHFEEKLAALARALGLATRGDAG